MPLCRPRPPAVISDGTLNPRRQHGMPIVNEVFILLVLIIIEEIQPARPVENVT